MLSLATNLRSSENQELCGPQDMLVYLRSNLASQASIVAYTKLDGGSLRVFCRDNYGIFVNRIRCRHVLRHHALQVAQPHLLAHHNHLILSRIEENHALKLICLRCIKHHNIFRLAILRFNFLDTTVRNSLRNCFS